MENPKNNPILDAIKAQAKTHEDQFDIATQAAIQRGFSRWFDDTWSSARANGALPNPFISSIFVFITTVLVKKFIGGFHKDMPMDHKEQAIADAARMLHGYIDQIEASALKDIHNPQPAPVTPKGNKQTIILPNKKFVQ